MAENTQESQKQQHTGLGQQLINISEGSLYNLEDNNKRWLLVGIGLNTVMAPVLRKYVKPRLDQLWLTFNNQYNIATQQYPNQMACYNTTYFNYEAINNNVVYGWKQKEKFNYYVKDSVDLSKLFLQTYMAKYSAFNDSCDLSALLTILTKTGICPSVGGNFAEKLKDQVRNPWAHCSYSLWDQTKYTESMDIIENLVVNLGLSSQEEHDVKSELELWKTKGQKFIEQNPEVLAEVIQQVQELVDTTDRIVVDTPDQMEKLKDELIGMLSNHENRLQKIEKTLFTQEPLPCVKRKTEDEDEVSKKKIKVEDTVPWNVRRRIEQMIKNWRVENKTFVLSIAVKKILKCVQENNYVTITGNSGMGKTATLRQVVLQLVEKGYDVIPVHESRDIEQYYYPDKITVFVVDDFCGKFSADKTEVEKWKRFLDLNYTLNDHVKIVVACRLQVFNDDLFKTIPVFQSCVCNLLSKDYRLSDLELQSIASIYLGSEAEKVTEFINTYDCFPLICKLYKQSPYHGITQFFRNPFEVYEKELEQMFSAKHYTKYCALMLCVVFNNSLEESLLTDDITDETRKVFQNVFEVCRLGRETSRIVIKMELDTLLDSFLRKEHDSYKTVHDKLFDVLSILFGKDINRCKCLIRNARSKFIAERFSFFGNDLKNNLTINVDSSLQEIYIQRMIDDWMTGKLRDVFSNKNIKNKEFRKLVLQCVLRCNEQQQKKLACTCDIVSDETVLTMCCIYGDFDWLSWCFKYQIDVNKSSKQYGISPLHVACRNGRTAIVKTFLERGADINQCTTDGASPLFVACQSGHTEIVYILIAYRADINKCTTNIGASPLHAACQNGHTEIVMILIVRGADINKCTTNSGASSLHLACKNGHKVIVTTLIEKGADINKCTTNIGASPLYTACQNGHTEILMTLIDKGADINKCTTDIGLSPLHIACEKGHTDIVTTLIDRRADINMCTTDKGASSLYAASQNGHTEIVTKLIIEGADINKCTTDIGASPLYIACQNGHGEIVTILIDRGADINKCRTDIGVSPLYVACHNGHTEIVTKLINKGADINKCTTDIGASPLFVASENGHTETVTTLINKGADINKCTTDIGVSPLYIASQNGHTEIVTKLIIKEADINKCTTDFGTSPLYITSQNGHTETVTTLIDRGADINKCTTDFGESPLYIASQNGHTEIVTKLIDRGADINKCTTDFGESPLYIASQNGHTETVTTLIHRGADINKCTTDFGESPLYIASQNGHTEIVTKLIDRGADINKCTTYFGESPLYIASQNGHTEIVTKLIDRGADINKCTTDNGASSLHSACYAGHIKIVQNLLKKGADHKIKLHDGRLPIDLARIRKHDAIVTMMELLK